MMLKNIIMKKEQEEESKLNNKEPSINKGFELMLRHISGGEEPSNPKTFQFSFGKMLSLFQREMHFQLDFFFNMKKK